MEFCYLVCACVLDHPHSVTSTSSSSTPTHHRCCCRRHCRRRQCHSCARAHHGSSQAPRCSRCHAARHAPARAERRRPAFLEAPPLDSLLPLLLLLPLPLPFVLLLLAAEPDCDVKVPGRPIVAENLTGEGSVNFAYVPPRGPTTRWAAPLLSGPAASGEPGAPRYLPFGCTHQQHKCGKQMFRGLCVCVKDTDCFF